MIKGDRLIINRKGITIPSKRMESIRIYPKSQIYFLPLRTFEYRSKESGTQFPIDIFITPIPPEKWPFVMRFNVRLVNRPGIFKKVYKFLERLHINVISSETIRSGHHHDTLNVLGEISRLEVKSLRSIFIELQSWKKDREKIYNKMYADAYHVDDFTHYFSGKQYENFCKTLDETFGKEKSEALLKSELKIEYSRESDKYYFKLEDLVEVLNPEKGKEDKSNGTPHFYGLNYGDYEKVPLDYVKEDIVNENGEFYNPMWYDIIASYTEKATELEDRNFSKKLEKKIDNENTNIEEMALKFLEDNKKIGNVKDEKDKKNHPKEVMEEFRNFIKDKNKNKECNFHNFVLNLLKHIKEDLEIDAEDGDLLKVIETIGQLLQKVEENIDPRFPKLKFYKDIAALTNTILKSERMIELLNLELKLTRKDDGVNIKDYLEKELNLLSEKTDSSDKKLFNKMLGIYLAYQYQNDNDISIETLLENEIKRARPKIFKLKTNEFMGVVSKYTLVQKEILLLKSILSALVTYKKMLGYRFKLLMVEDSLEYDRCKYIDDDFIKSPSENYLYNVRYYEHILKYPYFANRALLHSSLNNPFWKIKMLNIIDRFKRLPGELKIEWGVDPSDSLDPIDITPVEQLSHAFYHRVYEKDLTVKAEESHIPFPSRFPNEYLTNLLPKENYSTYGIASFNSESLSCRICPIPVSKLHRFTEIALTKNRSCHDDCVENGKKKLKKWLKGNLTHTKATPPEEKTRIEMEKMLRDDFIRIEKNFCGDISEMNLKNLAVEEIKISKLDVVIKAHLTERIDVEFAKLKEKYVKFFLSPMECDKKASIKKDDVVSEDVLKSHKIIEETVIAYLDKLKKIYEEKIKNKNIENVLVKCLADAVKVEVMEAAPIDHSMFEKYDPLVKKDRSCTTEANLYDDIYCNGSSMGLMSTWLNALSDPIDPIEEYGFNFNIWRTFNTTTQLDHEKESGEITVWAQAIKENFVSFPPDLDKRIQGKFNADLHTKFPHGHLRGEDIKVKKFFSGRIFVSIPFNHPMYKTWLAYIKKVGEEMGFNEVETTETFTKPVTGEVTKDISNSIGMIQVLSLPDRMCDEKSPKGLEWLYAEYLTALNLGLKVIRLLDTSTITDDLLIGKDHMNLKFSRMEPFSDFEKNVQKAFEILKKNLLDIYSI